MPPAATRERVLRACVLHEGRVLEEQRLERRAPLTVGYGPKNTFTIADPGLPRRFTLMRHRGRGYELVLSEGMRGRISTEDSNPVDVATLKAQGLLKKDGDYYLLPLNERHRGKVVIGDTTLIFQFVVPPPHAAPVRLPEAVRGGLLTGLDWTMATAFALIFAVELATIIGFHFAPKPAELTLETLDPRWANLIVPDFKKKEEKPPVDKSKLKSESKELAKRLPDPKDAADDEGRAKAKAARSSEIRKGIASKGVLAILGTMGDSTTGGAVADVLGDGGLATDLDSAFDGITGVGLATSAGQRTTRGAGAGTAASIGGLATEGGGNVGLGSKMEASVGSVRTEAPEVDGSLDSDAIARVVRARMRMVQDCYERELKRDPQLAGKVEIEFTIGADGSVTDARVAQNRMGSDEVGNCIVGRILRWKFPRPSGGSVTVNFPFIFTPSG